MQLWFLDFLPNSDKAVEISDLVLKNSMYTLYLVLTVVFFVFCLLLLQI